MELHTTRFGLVEVEPADVIRFPAGMLGLDDCREWVLLADAHNDSLGWLQSTSRSEIALAVVSPRRFVPDYVIRVGRQELAPLSLESEHGAHVLAIVGKNDRSITLNLKAPLIINLDRRLGRQVVVNGDQPVQYELCAEATTHKKIA
jgi:flagellar assembly factor FliW